MAKLCQWRKQYDFCFLFLIEVKLTYNIRCYILLFHIIYTLHYIIYIYTMFIILCSDFWIYSSVLRTKSLVSVHHLSLITLTPSTLTPCPSPSVDHFVLFGLFTYFEVLKKFPYEWNYTAFLSTWHISLSITYSKSIHFFFQIARFHSFLWLSSIPSYI